MSGFRSSTARRMGRAAIHWVNLPANQRVGRMSVISLYERSKILFPHLEWKRELSRTRRRTSTLTNASESTISISVPGASRLMPSARTRAGRSWPSPIDALKIRIFKPVTPARSARGQLLPADDRAHVPEAEEGGRHHACADHGSRRTEDKVADQRDGSAHRDRQQQQSHQREVVRDRDQILLLLAPEENAVARGRSDQQDRGQGDADQHAVVELLVEGAQSVEPLGERDRQQEREEHLNPGQRHTKLLEQVGEIPVRTLLLTLDPAAVELAGFVGARGLGRHRYFCVITTMPKTIAAITTSPARAARPPAATARTGRSLRTMSAERAMPKMTIEKAAVTPMPATREAITVWSSSLVSTTVPVIASPTRSP